VALASVQTLARPAKMRDPMAASGLSTVSEE